MWLFKRKEKCKFHEWKLSDYRQNICPVDIEEVYEVTCTKCLKSKIISEWDFEGMKKLGLIKE